MKKHKYDDLHEKALQRLREKGISDAEIERILEQQQIYQIELEIQHQELQKTYRELEKSNTKFKNLFDNMPSAYLVLSTSATIKEANNTALKMLQVSKGAILNRPFITFVEKKSHTLFLSVFNQLKKKNRSITNFELDIQTINKQIITVQVECLIDDNESSQDEAINLIMRDITNKKEAENIRSLLASIVESSNDAIVAKNLENKIISWNKAAEKIYGYTEEEVLGHSIEFVVPERYKAQEMRITKRIFDGEKISTYESRRIRKNGEEFDVALTISPITNEEGKIIGVSKITRDISRQKQMENELLMLNKQLDKRVAERTQQLQEEITIRKQAEKKLNISQERLDLALWAANLAWWDWNLATSEVWTSPQKLAMIGYTPEEFTPTIQSWIERIHPDDYDRAMQRMRDHIAGKLPEYEIKYRLATKDGGWVWLWDRGRVVKRDKNGKAMRITGTVQDISELKKSEAERDMLFNLSTDMMAIFDFEGNFKQVNPAWFHQLGWSESELINQSWIKFIHNEDVQEAHSFFNTLTKDSSAVTFQNRFYSKNGEYKWLSWNVYPLYKQQLVFAVVRDFTQKKHTDEELAQYRQELEKKVNERTSELEYSNKQLKEKIRQHQKAENDLKESRENFRQLAENINDVFWLATMDEIIYINPAFERIWEIETETARNNPVVYNQLIHPQDKELLLKRNPDNSQSPNETYLERQYRIITRNNHTKWISMRLFPVFNAEGKIFRFVGLASDISERIKIEYELKVAKERAEAANVAKSQFLANMSHEIRTPMNAILGFSEILREKLIEHTDYQEYIEGINKGVSNLLNLINDILDLSKIETGKLEINYTSINLYSLIYEIKQIFSVKLSQKNLEFVIDYNKSLPRTIVFDETRLRQILLNLVGNAVKFTHKGGIRLVVSGEFSHSDISAFNLIIKLIDTGIGIPEKQQELIFEPFRQREGQNSRKYGGTGLGLAITRRLVEMMNGTINVQSQLNKGSTFTVRFSNVALATFKVTKKEGIEYNNITFQKATILIVEDIDSNRRVVEEYLSNKNLDILQAVNGREAIEQAMHHRPALILMDIQMPVMDGLEASQYLKNHEKTRHIPIIALTASAMKEQVKKIMEICNDYISKPLEKSVLIKKLTQYLPYTEKKQKKKRQQPTNYLEQLKEIQNSGYHFSPKLQKEIQLKLIPLYEILDKKMSLNSLKSFSSQLIEIGEAHKFDFFIYFGNQFQKHVNAYKFEKINSLLKIFPEIVEIIFQKHKN